MVASPEPKKTSGRVRKRLSEAQESMSRQLMADDEFVMYSVKAVECPNKYPHPWVSCPFAHAGERARRRDLRHHYYSSTMCPLIRKGMQCTAGDSCVHSHNVFEAYLHPDRYRTTMCSDRGNCDRLICFFAHSLQQLRHPKKAGGTSAHSSTSSSPKAAATGEPGAAAAAWQLGGASGLEGVAQLLPCHAHVARDACLPDACGAVARSSPDPRVLAGSDAATAPAAPGADWGCHPLLGGTGSPQASMGEAAMAALVSQLMAEVTISRRQAADATAAAAVAASRAEVAMAQLTATHHGLSCGAGAPSPAGGPAGWAQLLPDLALQAGGGFGGGHCHPALGGLGLGPLMGAPHGGPIPATSAPCSDAGLLPAGGLFAAPCGSLDVGSPVELSASAGSGSLLAAAASASSPHAAGGLAAGERDGFGVRRLDLSALLQHGSLFQPPASEAGGSLVAGNRCSSDPLLLTSATAAAVAGQASYDTVEGLLLLQQLADPAALAVAAKRSACVGGFSDSALHVLSSGALGRDAHVPLGLFT